MDRLDRRREKQTPELLEGKELPENVVIVDRPEARYRILYESHHYRREHKVVEVEDVDAVAVEASGSFTGEGFLTAAGMHPDIVPQWIQPEHGTQKFISKMIENNTHLYLFDIEDEGD